MEEMNRNMEELNELENSYLDDVGSINGEIEQIDRAIEMIALDESLNEAVQNREKVEQEMENKRAERREIEVRKRETIKVKQGLEKDLKLLRNPGSRGYRVLVQAANEEENRITRYIEDVIKINEQIEKYRIALEAVERINLEKEKLQEEKRKKEEERERKRKEFVKNYQAKIKQHIEDKNQVIEKLKEKGREAVRAKREITGDLKQLKNPKSQGYIRLKQAEKAEGKRIENLITAIHNIKHEISVYERTLQELDIKYDQEFVNGDYMQYLVRKYNQEMEMREAQKEANRQKEEKAQQEAEKRRAREAEIKEASAKKEALVRGKIIEQLEKEREGRREGHLQEEEGRLEESNQTEENVGLTQEEIQALLGQEKQLTDEENEQQESKEELKQEDKQEKLEGKQSPKQPKVLEKGQLPKQPKTSEKVEPKVVSERTTVLQPKVQNQGPTKAKQVVNQVAKPQERKIEETAETMEPQATNDDELNILYSSRYGAYMIRNLRTKKDMRVKESQLDFISSYELAKKMGKEESDLMFVDIKLYQVLDQYDKQNGTNKAEQYLEKATQIGKSKEQRRKDMEGISIHMKYDLTALYDKKLLQKAGENSFERVDKFTKEERMELLNKASILERGFGTVKRGTKVWLREKIEKVGDWISSKVRRDNKRISEGKEKRAVIKPQSKQTEVMGPFEALGMEHIEINHQAATKAAEKQEKRSAKQEILK